MQTMHIFINKASNETTEKPHAKLIWRDILLNAADLLKSAYTKPLFPAQRTRPMIVCREVRWITRTPPLVLFCRSAPLWRAAVRANRQNGATRGTTRSTTAAATRRLCPGPRLYQSGTDSRHLPHNLRSGDIQLLRLFCTDLFGSSVIMFKICRAYIDSLLLFYLQVWYTLIDFFKIWPQRSHKYTEDVHFRVGLHYPSMTETSLSLILFHKIITTG